MGNAVFGLRLVYPQPKALARSQVLKASETKKSPNPTGDPQLNHEPQLRQCFKWSSYHLASWALTPWCFMSEISVYVNEDPSPVAVCHCHVVRLSGKAHGLFCDRHDAIILLQKQASGQCYRRLTPAPL